MGKRNLSKQQAARVKKIQHDVQFNETADKGLVLSRFGKHAEIESLSGHIIQCSLRPNLDSVVAGDHVLWQPVGDNQGIIVSRFARQSVLERREKRTVKIVAANITQLVIVLAPKPLITWTLLDSYLVMTEHLQLKALILLNKMDLPHADIEERLLTYEQLAYPILLTSHLNEKSMNHLEQALKTEVSVFVGQSGVGKSTLISHLLPQSNIHTAALSPTTELGCHTTSNSRYYHLPHGGGIIDSPGVREFGMSELEKKDIVYGFPEFRQLSARCKFRNCNHQDDPNCAIINSLIAGQTSQSRYESFISLLAQQAAGNGHHRLIKK